MAKFIFKYKDKSTKDKSSIINRSIVIYYSFTGLSGNCYSLLLYNIAKGEGDIPKTPELMNKLYKALKNDIVKQTFNSPDYTKRTLLLFGDAAKDKEGYSVESTEHGGVMAGVYAPAEISWFDFAKANNIEPIHSVKNRMECPMNFYAMNKEDYVK